MTKLLLLLSYVSFALAHPHTFIDIYPKLTIADGYVSKINFKWQMDEMTSGMLIMEFDQNANGKIDKSELKYIKDNYFLPLQDYDFYTHIKKIDKSKYKVVDFDCKILNGRILYIFGLELSQKMRLENLEMKFYDEDFFVAMMLKKKFVKQKIKYKIDELDNDYFFGYEIKYGK